MCSQYLIIHVLQQGMKVTDNLVFIITVFNLFSALEGEFYCPELYTHQISSGDLLYAMVFKPHCFQTGKKYPTVLNIYGGPEVQLVSNTFKVGMLASMFLTDLLKKIL